MADTATTTDTTTEARSTRRDARRTAEDAQRLVRGLLRDSAYVTIGAGDLAVATVRSWSEKAAERRAELRTEAPEQIRRVVDPREVRPRVEQQVQEARERAEHQVQAVREQAERLAERGRGVVDGVQRSTTTRRAADQVGTARSQVKAAATSVSKAARLVGDAAEETVESIGDESPVDYEAKTLEELREMAREREIPGRSSMNREELVEALRTA